MAAKIQRDELMWLIVQFVLFGFLEANELWSDAQHHWHAIGNARTISDYVLFPMMLITCLVRILRFKASASQLK